jgi:hypothetical protein
MILFIVMLTYPNRTWKSCFLIQIVVHVFLFPLSIGSRFFYTNFIVVFCYPYGTVDPVSSCGFALLELYLTVMFKIIYF